MNGHRHAFLTVALLAITTAILLPVFFGEAPTYSDRSGGDPWRNVILDFQTLITGVAAVAAAGITVSQMRKSDDRAEFRHRQLVDLTLRADRLRIERMLIPHFPMLQSQCLALETIIDAIRNEGGNSYHALAMATVDRIADLHTQTAAMETRAAENDWMAGRDLRGGELTWWVDQFVKHARRVSSGCARFSQEYPELMEGGRSRYKDQRGVGTSCSKILADGQHVIGDFKHVQEHVLALADFYNIEIVT